MDILVENKISTFLPVAEHNFPPSTFITISDLNISPS